MRVQLAIVTNQGIPVHTVVVPAKKFKDKIVEELRVQWGLRDIVEVQVLTDPIMRGAMHPTPTESFSLKRVSAYTDDKKRPKYYLIVTSAEIPNVAGLHPSSEWKFCPDCGCSWLAHLNGQAALQPDDWNPCPCTECGCMTAVKP